MNPGATEPAADLAALLNESFGQWAVAARAEPDGAGGALVRGRGEGRRVRVERLPAERPDVAGPPHGRRPPPAARWSLDGEPLASVLEVLREVRAAADPDFAPARLRISVPPPGGPADASHRPAPASGAMPGHTRAPSAHDHPGAASGRLPVFVLTGFLGSGKTTVLNRLLRERELRDTAVVVNELGAVGIDHLLVESSDDTVVELAGGCLCCAVRGDLALTLADLAARREAGACAPFSRILIETSGLADPTPVESLLLADPALAERFVFAGVSACVSAPDGDAALDRYPEAARQIAVADLIVLTKTDLAAAPPSLDERLRRLNPRAERATAVFGRLRTEAGAGALALPAERRGVDGGGAGPEPGAGAGAPPPIRHTDGIDHFVLVRPDPIPGAALALFLQSLVEHAGPRLLRLKGFVELAEAPGRPVTVNGAGHVFEPVEPRPGWPDADRRSRLVLIGEGISAAWCERVLDALVEEVGEAARRLAPVGPRPRGSPRPPAAGAERPSETGRAP